MPKIFKNVDYRRFDDRRHIEFLICVHNVIVLPKSVKSDQSEGIPERPFVKFAHRRSFASLRALFLYFFARLFSRYAPTN